MNPTQIICTKRDGEELSADQISWFVKGFAEGKIPDYQMAALAMAVYFQGMSDQETRELTRSMLGSGSVISWPDNGRPKVDKHSTGGIGDKISIALAPLLACLGMDVPMISGRGLGATGGTLDKLESIPGFRTDLSIEEMQVVIDSSGCVITGASQEIAPADRRFYALRDVTGTVPSIPLITASILSKKLAEGLDSLVLDVKFGSGAFMKSQAQAKALAESLVNVANESQVKTTALLTDMNQPLGRMIGNSVEVEESIAILKNNGPDDVRELTVALAAELLANTGLAAGDEAEAQVNHVLDSGKAYEKFADMVRAQGGELDQLKTREKSQSLSATTAGYVDNFNSEKIGWAIIELNGGRKSVEDTINHSTGVELLVQQGDFIEIDQPLFNVFCNEGIDPAVNQLLLDSITLSEEPPASRLLISDSVTY